MEVCSVFCHQDETMNHLFFQCCFARSIWSLIQVASSLYPSTSVANIFENWLHGIDLRFRMLLRWERLLWYGRYGYAEMTKFLMINIVLSCRFSTYVPVFFIYCHLYSGWRTVTYLWRSVHGWRLRQVILFPHMGGHIIYELDLHLLLRRSTLTHFSFWYVFCLFHFVWYLRLSERLCTS
jgi:hypothetical protein